MLLAGYIVRSRVWCIVSSGVASAQGFAPPLCRHSGAIHSLYTGILSSADSDVLGYPSPFVFLPYPILPTMLQFPMVPYPGSLHIALESLPYWLVLVGCCYSWLISFRVLVSILEVCSILWKSVRFFHTGNTSGTSCPLVVVRLYQLPWVCYAFPTKYSRFIVSCWHWPSSCSYCLSSFVRIIIRIVGHRFGLQVPYTCLRSRISCAR